MTDERLHRALRRQPSRAFLARGDVCLGLEVMIFLLVAAGLMYFVKKKVWAEVHA